MNRKRIKKKILLWNIEEKGKKKYTLKENKLKRQKKKRNVIKKKGVFLK